jgi:hypothetical protein
MMMANKAKLWLCSLAVVVAAMLGSAVQAKTWVATYDPPAYIGTATFDVPTACLAGVPDGQYNVTDFPGCSPIQIVGNVSTTPAIDFAAALPSSDVWSYVVIGGQFVGVDTGIIGSVLVSETSYWFQFASTFFAADGPNSPASVSNVVNLYDNCTLNSDSNLQCGEPLYQATTVTFATPEPGSLGLILGALGAGWWVRRRKAAA